MSGGLAVVRSLGSPRRLVSAAEFDDFQQELIDQWSLALAASGVVDSTVLRERGAVIEFTRFLGRHLWTAGPHDADRWLRYLRVQQRQAASTVRGKAGSIGRFYEFVLARYEGTIRRATGVLVEQPIDEFNRQSGASLAKVRVPPSDEEIDSLFTAWRGSIPQARKYLPAARDYFAASLWRRLGLRINETVMLDIRDWRPDLGEFGKLHVRFGKGSRGPRAQAAAGARRSTRPTS